MLAVEAHRRWTPEGSTANAVHPGAIFETNLSRHMSPDVLKRAAPTEATWRPGPPPTLAVGSQRASDSRDELRAAVLLLEPQVLRAPSGLLQV